MPRGRNRAIDPVIVASHITTALQTIVVTQCPAASTPPCSASPRSMPATPTTSSPSSAVMRGTARAFSTRDAGADRDATCGASPPASRAGFGATATLDFRILFPPLVNDAEETQVHRRHAPPSWSASENVNRNGSLVDGVGGFLLHAGRAVPAPISRSATATARAAARCTTPAMISTMPRCRSARASSRGSSRKGSRASRLDRERPIVAVARAVGSAPRG